MSEPLAEALALQATASEQGFDWSALDELWPKLFEEIEELKEASGQGQERSLDELGDLLFMVVNLARHLNVDPQAALRAANAKFQRRYGHVIANEATLPPIGDVERIRRMEALWVEAKLLGL